MSTREKVAAAILLVVIIVVWVLMWTQDRGPAVWWLPLFVFRSVVGWIAYDRGVSRLWIPLLVGGVLGAGSWAIWAFVWDGWWIFTIIFLIVLAISDFLIV